ncbi:protein-methionine-sulfoxide reductase catalytic subunit MsrP [Candidatus Thiothrix sp. Deng01]|uniref:Protein-methionine-sulfoxide reductase catalytic subunit MsrP n=1 Tax=Candidatus Thiothrix phosphatis TaxID=3112415 RepID=A0ABU6CX98_9GAMM|nr:protein-methionine-sulfoxide reductase catalytic subunit MsrP [Candidatus Thiothrix sp. Deng01]MEB4591038.1 protein-methionine-sulfoxide reductase catalytic subunit MsrP [Candidatus Thiothrix sp. Deng01]
MLIKRPQDISENEVTAYSLYQGRRDFLKTLGGVALLGAGGLPLTVSARSGAATSEELTPYDDITSYNNFIELGAGKYAPAEEAGSLRPRPWSVTVDGECAKPGKFALDDLLKLNPVEERIYRLRCVEGWSMVIPWQGFPLGKMLKRFEPTSKAKFVRFETLYDPKQMPEQRSRAFDWPYVEGLRIDEAMHPLTLMATGLYGKDLPGQSGAPLRLVVPWKYGYKSAKSIVRISFVEKMPTSLWMATVPDEYGFYANVNPNVSHPRWSQKRERRIGEFFKRPTEMFNGYADQVASLYRGMDLKENY